MVAFNCFNLINLINRAPSREKHVVIFNLPLLFDWGIRPSEPPTFDSTDLTVGQAELKPH